MCRRCNTEKFDDAFGRKKNKLQAYCRDCNRSYEREHYRNNTDVYRDRRNDYAQKQSGEVFLNLIDYLKQHPCVDCGEADVIVLQFDHVRGEKTHNIADLLHGRTRWVTVEREIEKCDVRCANCHIRRTARQFGWRKHALAAVDSAG